MVKRLHLELDRSWLRWPAASDKFGFSSWNLILCFQDFLLELATKGTTICLHKKVPKPLMAMLCTGTSLLWWRRWPRTWHERKSRAAIQSPGTADQPGQSSGQQFVRLGSDKYSSIEELSGNPGLILLTLGTQRKYHIHERLHGCVHWYRNICQHVSTTLQVKHKSKKTEETS